MGQTHEVAIREVFTDEGTMHAYGLIQLTLDKPWYEPGDIINGKVFIRVNRTINEVNGIELKFKGGLKHAFTRFWEGRVENGDYTGDNDHQRRLYANQGGTFVEYNERLSDSKKIISHS